MSEREVVSVWVAWEDVEGSGGGEEGGVGGVEQRSW